MKYTQTHSWALQQKFKQIGYGFAIAGLEAADIHVANSITIGPLYNQVLIQEGSVKAESINTTKNITAGSLTTQGSITADSLKVDGTLTTFGEVTANSLATQELHVRGDDRNTAVTLLRQATQAPSYRLYCQNNRGDQDHI